MKYTLFFILCLTVLSCFMPATVSAQTDDEEPQSAGPRAEKNGGSLPFPFRAYKGGDGYDLVIDLTDAAVRAKFKPAFGRAGVPYTPASFEELVQQIAVANPALTRIMITATTENSLLIDTGNPIYRDSLIALMQRMLHQPAQLEQMLKDLDPEGPEEE